MIRVAALIIDTLSISIQTLIWKYVYTVHTAPMHMNTNEAKYIYNIYTQPKWDIWLLNIFPHSSSMQMK